MEVGLAVIDAKKDSLSKRFSAPLYRSQLSQNSFEILCYTAQFSSIGMHITACYTKDLNLCEFPHSHNRKVENVLVENVLMANRLMETGLFKIALVEIALVETRLVETVQYEY